MFPLDLVTEVEKKAIKNHIDNNAENGLQTSVDYILREWNEQKNLLFNAVFNGNKLILEREVCFKRGYDSIVALIDNTWDDMPEEANDFVRDFDGFVAAKRDECWGSTPRWAWSEECNKDKAAKESEWFNCNLLMSNSVLADNAVKDEFTIELPKGDGTSRKYKVQTGSKPMRVLSKINQAYHFSSEENYKAFCSWHSQILNDKSIKGKLCLSIHPLDYMTMSQNTHGWSSCMNWEDSGCYRSGTVEMMNSPIVIVVYLKSDNAEMTMDLGYDYKNHVRNKMNWNSKKWRTLIIVDRSGIYSVKAYPYQHEEMTKYAMKWINELCGGEYVDEPVELDPYHDSFITYNDKEYIYDVNPRTFRMYNDFGSTTHYMMPAIKELESMEKVNQKCRTFHILYSGASECMSCGGLNYDNDFEGVEFDSEENLVCNDCNPDVESYYCEECGRSMTNEDEVVWVEDVPICPDCYDRVCFEDQWTGESAFKDGGIIDLTIKDGRKKYHVGNVIPWNVVHWVNPNVVIRVQNFIDNKLNGNKKRFTLNAEDLNQGGSRHLQSTKDLIEFRRRYA